MAKFESKVQEWREKFPNESGIWPVDDVSFLEELLVRDLISYNTHKILLARLELPPEPDVTPTVVWEEYRREVGDALFDKMSEWFRMAYHETLVSLWRWMIDKLKELIDLVVGALRPILQQAWEFAKSKFEDVGRSLYDGAFKIFEGHSPIRPEDAPAMALKLYLFAMGMGMAAHGAATATELLHPLKTVGLHQTAAILSDFGGFGRICGATMGPLVNRVLGQAMTYAVQDRYRPVIPRESLLIELRSKREIDKPAFVKAMGYQGFDNDWIDVIERWQWKDPRMFELMRVADVGIDQGPPPPEEMWWFTKFGVTGDKLKDWWLYRKLMRAGYEDVDLPVLIRTIHRREYSFAMTYVRTAIRRNYRYGFLDEKGLIEWTGKLKLPDEAVTWIRWAGQLDMEYFYQRDLVMYYKLAYRNDIIGDDDLIVSLLAMGLPSRNVMMIVRTERVRKAPKVSQPVVKAAEKAASDIQKKTITLYIEQYRKDLITAELLLESLLAIGLAPDLAEVSVDLELAKKGLPPAAELS